MSDTMPTEAEQKRREELGLSVQPAPEQTGLPSAHDLLCEAIQKRKLFGLEKYNSLLTAFNGRDQLADGLDELLDFGVYLVSAIQEQKALRDGLIEDRGTMTVRGLVNALLEGGPGRYDLPVFVDGVPIFGPGDSEKYPGTVEITLLPPPVCPNCGRRRHDGSREKCYLC